MLLLTTQYDRANYAEVIIIIFSSTNKKKNDCYLGLSTYYYAL